MKWNGGSLPKTGWKTVDVSRNEVPAQKASIAVPLSTLAIMGKATLIEVASSAAISVMTDRQLNATTNLQSGLKVFAKS